MRAYTSAGCVSVMQFMDTRCGAGRPPARAARQVRRSASCTVSDLPARRAAGELLHGFRAGGAHRSYPNMVQNRATETHTAALPCTQPMAPEPVGALLVASRPAAYTTGSANLSYKPQSAPKPMPGRPLTYIAGSVSLPSSYRAPTPVPSSPAAYITGSANLPFKPSRAPHLCRAGR